MLPFVNKSNLSCYDLKERQVCGVKLENRIYLLIKGFYFLARTISLHTTSYLRLLSKSRHQLTLPGRWTILADRVETPSFCLMVECSNDKRKCPHISFGGVPKVRKNQGESTEALSEERRWLWLAAISRADLTGKILKTIEFVVIIFILGKWLLFGTNITQIGLQPKCHKEF